MYRIYQFFNIADTCSEPDNLVFEEFGFTDSLEKAKSLVKEIIKTEFFCKDTEILPNVNGSFYAQDFCSYGATVVIERMREI